MESIQMSFKITARTLLELGAELISSDAIALYELIKNGVDARSPLIKIRVQSILSHSRYQQALEYIDEDVPLETLKEDISSWLEIDAPSEAKREFHSMVHSSGNNRENFRKNLVKAYCDLNYIQVEDTGEGMSLDDLENIYLTIGTRSRKQAKKYSNPDGNGSAVAYLGDKGVGRLSVMRLGDKLDVITTQNSDNYWNHLSIDWRQFSHDSDLLLHEISVTPYTGERKKEKNETGTKIRITNLKSDWNRARFNELLDTEFSRMIDPFEGWRANKLLRIYYNGTQVTLTKIEERLLQEAHSIVDFKFYYDESAGEATISGEMNYRLHANRKKPISYNEAAILSFTNSKSLKIIKKLGSFDVKFIWFNRKYLAAVEGIGAKEDVRKLVNKWAGGLMVFRDGFRINPYGGPDDDWLHLDKRAFSRSGYKLNRNQVIGRVRLGGQNNFLIEQTNREGLVDNEYKFVFVSILQRILEDFKTFSQGIEDELKREQLTSLDTLRQKALEAKSEIQKKIRHLIVQVPEQAGPLNQIEKLVTTLAKQIDGVEEIVDDYRDERKKFVHLASLGLMIELILHELGRASGNTLGTLESIELEKLPGKLPAVFKTLETQLKTLQKRIETLNPLSTARRQTKETFDLTEVIHQVVDARAAQAHRHKVTVEILSTNSKTWRIKAVRGMIIQIIENLLANSFYWLKHQAIVHRDTKLKITIILNKETNTISITDNGPGVEPERADEIFLPFVTSKPPGKGSGLGLYIAKELATYHKWSLDISRTPKKSRNVLDTFILDLSGENK